MDTEEASGDDLFRCAVCGFAEGDYTNATVQCGHEFCNWCIDRELSFKREFPCPICNTAVKRVTLREASCEKDTSWRRRLLAAHNI
jgi:hypothetical protein